MAAPDSRSDPAEVSTFRHDVGRPDAAPNQRSYGGAWTGRPPTPSPTYESGGGLTAAARARPGGGDRAGGAVSEIC